MKIEHNIKDKSKLSHVEIQCYREDTNGRKIVETIPHLGTVDNPEVSLVLHMCQPKSVCVCVRVWYLKFKRAICSFPN